MANYPKNRKAPSNKVSPEVRFWNHVVKGEPTECWEWRGFCNPHGYGIFRANRQEVPGAHRYSYSLHKGRIPTGMVVMHSCDNRKCVNPHHLNTGTSQDNTADRDAKGRHAHGSRHFSAKLSERDIPAIRLAISNGGHPLDIASTFNVHVTTINDIKQHRTWRHVPLGGVS